MPKAPSTQDRGSLGQGTPDTDPRDPPGCGPLWSCGLGLNRERIFKRISASTLSSPPSARRRGGGGPRRKGEETEESSFGRSGGTPPHPMCLQKKDEQDEEQEAEKNEGRDSIPPCGNKIR